jgi:predicted nucleotidyltransferase
MKLLRPRDFIEDRDGWLYAVAGYDNEHVVASVLRYIPHPEGERRHPERGRFRKLTFDEANRLVAFEKPGYNGRYHRVPVADIVRVFKPEDLAFQVTARNRHARELVEILQLRPGSYGFTGSLLCGLESDDSDIDMVVYGDYWFQARDRLRDAVANGILPPISDRTWRQIYAKRHPSLSFDEFVMHERRKWNRGETGETYFDLLFTRDYHQIESWQSGRGKIIGRQRIEAIVTDTTYAYDSPALYRVSHPEINWVISFTHTYTGQAAMGETIEASGTCEEHDNERWLVIGTTGRESPGEYIRSLTLLNSR